jgi:hypothetical protein
VKVKHAGDAGDDTVKAGTRTSVDGQGTGTGGPGLGVGVVIVKAGLVTTAPFSHAPGSSCVAVKVRESFTPAGTFSMRQTGLDGVPFVMEIPNAVDAPSATSVGHVTFSNPEYAMVAVYGCPVVDSATLFVVGSGKTATGIAAVTLVTVVDGPVSPSRHRAETEKLYCVLAFNFVIVTLVLFVDAAATIVVPAVVSV